MNANVEKITKNKNTLDITQKVVQVMLVNKKDF